MDAWTANSRRETRDWDPLNFLAMRMAQMLSGYRRDNARKSDDFWQGYVTPYNHGP
jgi:hypothetical protein